jgi:hypothetical protein
MKVVISLARQLGMVFLLLLSYLPYNALALTISLPPGLIVSNPKPFESPIITFPEVPQPIIILQPVIDSPPPPDFIWELVPSNPIVITSPFPFDSGFTQIGFDGHRRYCIPTIFIVDGIETTKSDCQDNTSQVPEPASLGLLALGAIALFLQRRKRQY